MNRLTAILMAICIVSTTLMAQEPKKKNKRDEAESLFDYVQTVQSSNSAFAYAIIANPEIDATDTVGNRLAQAINELNKMPKIAFVVLLGNITRDGQPASMEAAKSILRNLTVPYYALPGNRDLSHKESGGTDFKRIFGDDKFRANINGLFFIGLNTGTIADTANGHLLPQNSLWLRNQLKNVGKKISVYLFTSNALTDSQIDNWRTITDQVRRFNTQLCVSANDNRFARQSYDDVAGYTIEQLSQSYTIANVWEDTVVFSRKVLGRQIETIDTINMEIKTYLEAGRTKSEQSTTGDKKVWSFTAPFAVYSAVAHNDNYCYFGDDNGTLYCLDLKKGKLRWKYQTSLRIVVRPTVIGDLVLFGSCDKGLYCLGAEKGDFKWRLRTNNAVTEEPIVENGMVYIEKNDTMLYTVELATGEEMRPARREQHPRPEQAESRKTPISGTDYILTDIDGHITRYTTGQ